MRILTYLHSMYSNLEGRVWKEARLNKWMQLAANNSPNALYTYVSRVILLRTHLLQCSCVFANGYRWVAVHYQFIRLFHDDMSFVMDRLNLLTVFRRLEAIG
jgi:hypothetical protein